MEVEASDLLEQRGVRCHRAKKFFRKRKVACGPDLIRKHCDRENSFAEADSYFWASNGIPNEDLTEKQVPLKDLDLDPFATRSFQVAYSLNKKKRWMAEKLLAEDIESYQTESLRVTGASLAITALDTKYHTKEQNLIVAEQTIARSVHTVKKGEKIHKKSKNAALHGYLNPELPPRRRRGRRIKNPQDSEVDLECTKYEENMKPYERRFHQIYTIYKKDWNKSCINANHDISKKASVRESSFYWYHHYDESEEEEERRPSQRKAQRALRDFYYDREIFGDEEECSEDAQEKSSKPSEVLLSDFVHQKKSDRRKRKPKRARTIEDYRPFITEDEVVEREEAELPVVEEHSSPETTVIVINPLQRMDHLDIDVSKAKSLPTVPPLFSAATPDGDLVIIRNGEFFSNPKGREVVEETRKKDADPKKNIFCEMKTLCLERPQAVEPSAAEKLALKLATEEIESKRSIQTESETLQVEKECGICTEEGFQVALSSCGHFSCVQCWTSYVTHAIHDNRVPMRCFGEKCLEVIPVPVVQSFVHQELVRRYEKQLVNRRLLQDDFLFCKRCEKFLFLATSPTASSRIVICECGASWCRGCREEAHEPLSCENMRKYEDMLQRSGQSFHNVSLAHVANGVKCPKCAGLIDRTTGCNHMECICGYEFCYACREPFAGSHYDCGTDAREDFALIDGAETVHLGVFQKCILLRRKRSADSLLEMQRRLEKGVSAEKVKALLDRFQQLLEFLERALVHRFLSYGRVRFKSGHFLAQQFGSLEDRLQFLLNRSEVEKEVLKMEAMLGSALRICDSLNERCMRM